MISVAEAKKIILDHVKALPPVKHSLQQALGETLAEDIFASVDIPAFPQSSMDGYAFLFNDWKSKKPIFIEGEIAAGAGSVMMLEKGTAVRIFTGAPVPTGADTVVMQEKIKVKPVGGKGNELIIDDDLLQQGTNVRQQGSEMKAGELALSKGSYLSPAAIGFLAGIGVAEVNVCPLPSVSIIVTGKELQQPGKPLQYGQVYESNSFTLKAVLQQLNIPGVKVVWANDDLEELKTALAHAFHESDLVLLTGGISAGDYDFVLEAATECEVQKLFHKVKQRPGKPLYFGMKKNTPVFGLPGNPSSVLTCFYQYVMPALGKLSNAQKGLKTVSMPLGKPFRKAPGLTHFLKGFYDDKAALPLDAQESYRLKSFAKANCLIQIDEEMTECKEGDMVVVHLLTV